VLADPALWLRGRSETHVSGNARIAVRRVVA
jgi:hypothetical protein